MTINKTFFILILFPFIVKGQEKLIHQIITREYSVSKIGANVKKGKMQSFYLKYYNNDGTEKKVEVFGSAEKPKNDKYDEQGNRVQWNLYNQDGSIREKHLYKYDQCNNKIEQSWFDGSNNLIIREEYDYDYNRNMTRWEKYENESSSFYKFIYKYDSLNNKTEQIEYKKNEFVARYLLKYNINNRLIESNLTDSLGVCLNKSIIQYNGFGDPVAEKTFDAKNNIISLIKYEYVYNNNNHWIIKRKCLNEILNQIIEREITYY